MPLFPELVADLDRIRAERPGATKQQLLFAARRAGIVVRPTDVDVYFRDHVSTRGLEITHQQMPSKGRFYSEGPDERWQADLAIYKFPRKGKIGFLLVMDVFSRMIYAEPIENKFSTSVLEAFKAILERASYSNAHARRLLEQLVLTTDRGPEFAGAFRNWIVRQGVMWRVRTMGAQNDIGSLDQAMGRLKLLLRQRRLDTRRAGAWDPDDLQKVVDEWNTSYNKKAHGTPEEADNPTQEFLIKQDMAKALAHNHDNELRMEAAVMRHKRFRPPVILENQLRNRIFSDRFRAPKQAHHWSPGSIFDTAGNEHPLKLLLPLGPSGDPVEEEDEPGPPRRGTIWAGARRLGRTRAGPRRGPAERGVVRDEPARRPVRQPVRAPGPPVEPPGPPVEPPRASPASLPADPAVKLTTLKRYRNLLLTQLRRAWTDEEQRFMTTWSPLMPERRGELDKEIRRLS